MLLDDKLEGGKAHARHDLAIELVGVNPLCASGGKGEAEEAELEA
jgi:hypothetical protein